MQNFVWVAVAKFEQLFATLTMNECETNRLWVIKGKGKPKETQWKYLNIEIKTVLIKKYYFSCS